MSYNPVNPNGQATSANSAPVVVASDQSAIPVSLSGGATAANQTNGTQQTQITDVNSVVAQNMTPGTANSSGNAQLIGPTSYTQSFSFTSVTGGTVYDVGNYTRVSVHVTAFYTGSTTPTLTFQTSNDGTNWVSNTLTSATATGAAGVTTTSTSGTLCEGTIRGRYFRLSQTGTYTSGTTTGTLVFSTGSTAPATQQVSTIAGSLTITTGSITTSSTAVTTASLSTGGFTEISIHGTYAGVSFGITVSDDAGTTFYPVSIYDAAAQAWLAPGATITPGTNASKHYWVPVPAASCEIKVLSSAYTSGTGSVRIVSGYTSMPPSDMTQIQDAAGNNRGANVNASNQLSVSVDNNPVIGAGTNTIGNTIGAAATSGGLSMGGSATLSNTAVAVKASAGQVYGWYIYNPNTSIAFVQFYNSTTGSTTVGTNALNPLGIPAGGAANVFTYIGLAFSTAITIAACTTATGSTAPTSSLTVNIYYN